jgi:serine/threonine protein kinase
MDARTDVWSIGALIFYALTGQHVHPARNMIEAIMTTASTRSRSLATLLPNLLPSAIRVVDRALVFEKEGRYPDARAMQLETHAVLKELAHSSAERAFPSVDVEIDPLAHSVAIELDNLE